MLWAVVVGSPETLLRRFLLWDIGPEILRDDGRTFFHWLPKRYIMTVNTTTMTDVVAHNSNAVMLLSARWVVLATLRSA